MVSSEVRILSSGARIIGRGKDLPTQNQAEVQRILEREARRLQAEKLAADRAAYALSNRECESSGGER